jgi:Na+/melibiose symporter-like transporter
MDSVEGYHLAIGAGGCVISALGFNVDSSNRRAHMLHGIIWLAVVGPCFLILRLPSILPFTIF